MVTRPLAPLFHAAFCSCEFAIYLQSSPRRYSLSNSQKTFVYCRTASSDRTSPTYFTSTRFRPASVRRSIIFHLVNLQKNSFLFQLTTHHSLHRCCFTMPLLKRKRFPLLQPPPYDPEKKESRDRQVWYSPITAEIFTDYS